MKICGTVRRPVSCDHVLALRRVEVDADLVDVLDPALRSSALARTQ
jgi:hypothetical protein